MPIPTFAIQGRPKPRLGGWTEDLARSINSSDMARLQNGVQNSLDSVARAWDALNALEDELNTLGSMISQAQASFGGPDPNDPESPGSIAFTPLQVAEAHTRVGGRRVAGIDVLFYQLSLVYTDMGNTFAGAGFTSESGSLRMAAQAMRGWRAGAAERIYPRISSALDARAAIEAQFRANLAQAGLQDVVDNDKPGYFDILQQTLAPLSEDPTPEEASMQGASLGADPVTIGLVIAGIIKVVVIAAAIIAALYVVNKIVENIFGAGNSAMKAAAELQARKTLREQQVANGTLSRQDADAQNAADSQQFKQDVDNASAAAAKAGPSVTDLLLWVGIPVAGAGVLLGILKISGVI